MRQADLTAMIERQISQTRTESDQHRTGRDQRLKIPKRDPCQLLEKN